MWFRALLLTLILFAAHAFAQDTTERDAIAAYNSGNYVQSVVLLLKIRSNTPDTFTSKHFDYLLGRAAERSGDHALAMTGYHSAARHRSPLREYALYRMSKLAAASGDHFSERLYLSELQTFFPDSLLKHTAEIGILHSYFHSNNYLFAANSSSTTNYADKFSANSSSHAEVRITRNAQLITCRSHLYLGNNTEARSCFDTLLSTTPDANMPDDFALESVRGLDVLDGAAENNKLRLSADEHLRRGLVYQFNRDFIDARGHFTSFIDEHYTDPRAPDAVFNIGRGYALRSEFADASVWFERLIEQYPEHPLLGEALLNAASAYSRSGKYREALTRYQMFIDRFPNAPNVDRAYLNPIDLVRDHDLKTEALRRAAEVQQLFRGKTAEAQALFAEARIYISKEDWQLALDSLDRLANLSELGGSSVPGGTSTAEIKFLRAMTYEKMNDIPQAISGYLSIPDGRNEYYGWRATERLRRLATDEKTTAFIDAVKSPYLRELSSPDPETRRKNLQTLIRLTVNEQQQSAYLAQLKEVYLALPNYAVPMQQKARTDDAPEEVKKAQDNKKDRHSKLADIFKKLGIYDDAAAEYEAGLKLANKPNDIETVMLYDLADKAYRGIAISEPAWRNIPADFQIELIPHEAARLLYPAPYAEFVTLHAADKKVDPRFLLSIMRQESRFRPDIRSVATARGLMQFIPSTADRIANQLNITNFSQDHLYDPETAILFGAQYTGDLLKMFPNQYQAAAASYNGGEDNMRRWYGRSVAEDPDRYVPEIAFAQTKDYVFKVMANFRVYRTLYGEDLKLK